MDESKSTHAEHVMAAIGKFESSVHKKRSPKAGFLRRPRFNRKLIPKLILSTGFRQAEFGKNLLLPFVVLATGGVT